MEANFEFWIIHQSVSCRLHIALHKATQENPNDLEESEDKLDI